MGRIPLWAVFAVVFAALFCLFAGFRTDFPATPGWVAGTIPARQFFAPVRLNGPAWAAVSAAGAALATAAVEMAPGCRPRTSARPLTAGGHRSPRQVHACGPPPRGYAIKWNCCGRRFLLTCLREANQEFVE